MHSNQIPISETRNRNTYLACFGKLIGNFVKLQKQNTWIISVYFLGNEDTSGLKCCNKSQKVPGSKPTMHSAGLRVGCLSPAKRKVGFELGTFRLLVTRLLLTFGLNMYKMQ